MKHVIERCKAYAHLGKIYEPTESMLKMAADGKTYYAK